MNISSLVLRASPAKRARVRAALAALPGVDIRADAGDGRFVLILEEVAGTTAEGTFAAIQTMDGVLSVALVYQYCDDPH